MVFELGLGHFSSVPRVTVVVKYCLMREFVTSGTPVDLPTEVYDRLVSHTTSMVGITTVGMHGYILCCWSIATWPHPWVLLHFIYGGLGLCLQQATCSVSPSTCINMGMCQMTNITLVWDILISCYDSNFSDIP